MEFTSHTKDGIVFIRISGDLLGMNREQEMLDYVQSKIDDEPVSGIADISDVGYMNSIGLSVLVRMLTRFRNKDGDLILINPSKQIQKLLVITKLNAIFTVVESEEEALKILKASA